MLVQLCQSKHKSLSESGQLQVMREGIRTGQEIFLSYILPGILTQGRREPEVVSLHLKGFQRFFSFNFFNN